MEQVSVIVPNFNGLAVLHDCLESLATQDYPEIEVIVVDDGSSDVSPDLVERDFPAVRLIRLAKNGGFACAANMGMREARGQIIALLNNDAAAAPGWVRALVEALGRHPEAGAAASKMLLWDRAGVINSAGDIVRRNGMPDSRGVWEHDLGQYEDETEVFGGCGGAVAYRRTMLDEIGLFDERFYMYCEDVDLAFRAQYAGYTCVYVPRAVVRHRMSATGGGRLASYYVGRNVVWLLARDFPGPAWRRYGVQVVAAQVRLFLSTLPRLREPAARARLQGQIVGLLTAPRLVAERAQFIGRRPIAEARLVGLLT